MAIFLDFSKIAAALQKGKNVAYGYPAAAYNNIYKKASVANFPTLYLA